MNNPEKTTILWSIETLGPAFENRIHGEIMADKKMSIMQFYELVAPDAVKVFYALDHAWAIPRRYDFNEGMDELPVNDLDDDLNMLEESDIKGLRFMVRQRKVSENNLKNHYGLFFSSVHMIVEFRCSRQISRLFLRKPSCLQLSSARFQLSSARFQFLTIHRQPPSARLRLSSTRWLWFTTTQ